DGAPGAAARAGASVARYLVRAASAISVDEKFLFSATVELMSMVAVGLRPSVQAAYQAPPDLPVSVQAVYDKIKRTDPGMIRALVRDSAERLSAVAESIWQAPAATLKRYWVRVIDG